MTEEEMQTKHEEFTELLDHSSGESDRGRTLIIAAYIDDFLRKLIEFSLINSKEVESLFEGPYAPFSSLSGKTKAAYLMGLITKNEKKRIDAIRGVRNVYAHHMDANFDHPKIKKICRKEPVFDGRLCDRDSFLHMAINTVIQIMYRDLDLNESYQRQELILTDIQK